MIHCLTRIGGDGIGIRGSGSESGLGRMGRIGEGKIYRAWDSLEFGEGNEDRGNGDFADGVNGFFVKYRNRTRR